MTELEQLLQQHEILAKRLLAGSKPSVHVSQTAAAAEERRTLRRMEPVQTGGAVSSPSAKGQDPILLPQKTFQEEAEQTAFRDAAELPDFSEAALLQAAQLPDFSEAALLQAAQLSRIYERDARRYPGEECPC